MNIPAFLPYIWLTVLVLSVVTEAITSRFIALCLFPAALASLAASMLKLPLGAQLTIFAVIVTAAVVLRFTAGEKYLKNRESVSKQLESFIGRSAVVADSVTGSRTGHVEIDGRLWPAVAGEGKEFKKGDTVYICEYSENRLICK
ncbi:MAG: hypothetical protein K6D94_00760 [Clostridiales bacterium]|nr:hypothetical protein [Clostridiales bacterium]